MILYNNIPCPLIQKKEPDSYLIIYKSEQKLIYECSLGYGQVTHNEYGSFYEFEGKFHRENGPAITHNDGYKAWYVKGKLHRLDGPAVEYPNGIKLWYNNGIYNRIQRQ